METFKFALTDTLSISLRAIMRDGEPWFIAMDVAGALDYSDTFEMTKRLDNDQKQNLHLAGFGNRGVAIINESGLYEAIFASHKTEAKAFRRWITDEVLPTIRKQGAYVQGASKLSPEAQDAFYAHIRAQLAEAMRRHDGATEHDHYRSFSRQREWSRLSSEKIAREMGLPVDVVVMATAHGVDAGMKVMVKGAR